MHTGKREQIDRNTLENASRELTEETGLSLQSHFRLLSSTVALSASSKDAIVEYSFKGNPSVYYFVAILRDECADVKLTLEAGEHLRIDWVPLQEALKLTNSGKRRHLLLQQAIDQAEQELSSGKDLSSV
jgi:8-oxo-dGTP pyrophosphatase MutT (NUDIX family)